MTLLYYNQHLVGDDYWKEIGSIDVTTRNPVTIDVTSKVVWPLLLCFNLILSSD